MGERSVIEPTGQPGGPVPRRPRRPSWKLKPPHDTRTQGMVVSGFDHLEFAEALFLVCDAPAHAAHREGKAAWLQALGQVAPITDADRKDPRSASIAFTCTGLKQLGLSPQILSSFSAPFREGMYQEDRLRRLGDRIDGKWQGTVIDDGPLWGGNTPVREVGSPDVADAFYFESGRPKEPQQPQVPTPITVHALLLLYEKDQDALNDWARQVIAALAPYNVNVVRRLRLDLQFDPNRVAREHFGFADGLSQPVPFDGSNEEGTAPDSVVLVDGRPAKRDDWHGIRLGDILFGHTNAHHEKAPGPVVPDDTDGRQAGLVPSGAPEGFLNFGLDGTYLVVRELRQYVTAFWKSMEEGAARIRAHDPSATHATTEWLSERVVGRNLDGHLLCPSGFLKPDADNYPQNAFGFIETDPFGHGCPPGSHVRRANPRDGLAKDKTAARTLLDAANNHRILRRGRKYGPKVDGMRLDDSAERGLLFMCLNTDIARQFEFVQQTWLHNKSFATLLDETDPLIGPKGPFTIREQPLRRIVEVKTFIQMAGGEYFFLPSVPALKYLATISPR
jgi:deferrochelatase/peroxidase EfeB